MKGKRIVKGNKTTIPSGSYLIGSNITNAVTLVNKDTVDTPAAIDCTIEAREFMEENEK